MKSNSENNEEKENFFKKILHNKVGLCVFVIVSSVLVDIIIVNYLPRILKLVIRDYFKLSNINFVWIGFLLLYFIFSFRFLKFIRKIKNDYSKSKSITRFLLDYIFILEWYYLVSIFIRLFLLKIDNYLSHNDIEMFNEFVALLTLFYVLNYVIKNVINKSWRFILIMFLVGVLFITFLGMIDLNYLGLITLICTIMSQFMSYDNIKYLYGKLSRVDYSTINEEKTKEQISFAKVIINTIIILLYFYIVLTEGIKIPQIVNNKAVEISILQYIWDNIFNTSISIPSFIWKGIIRFGILYILLVIITSCIYVCYLFKIAWYSIKIFWFSKIFKNDKKKSEYSEKKKKENEKKYFQYKLILKKYLKKNIIRVKRHIEMNKSKINKTNIKTSIHINSRKKYHRIYKYKNIEFHNKKPSSN